MLVPELRMASPRPRKRMKMTGGNSKFTQRGADMTNSESAPDYTRRFWAKSEPRDGYPKRIHLLEHHLADVGACFEALLAQPAIRQRLARTAGRDDLDQGTVARLCVFAALHDIGKVNTGFQTQIWTDNDLGGMRKPRWASHTSDLVPVLLGDDHRTNEWFLDALGWDEFLGWDSDNGNTVSALFAAAFSHHGQPLNLYDSKAANPAIWRPFAGLDPEESVRRIGYLVRRWFPEAFADGAPPLPSHPTFQHMFLGLCTLADWIGSTEDWFEFVDVPKDYYVVTARSKAAQAIKDVGLDLVEQRSALSAISDFGELFDLPGNPPPNAIQRRAALETPLDEPLVILESETGSGKTEAALWRFARMYQAGLVDGLYFALPTRSAASQLHGRVNKFITNMFPTGHKPEPVLAVPGYLRAGDFTGQHLSRYEVWWEDHPGHDDRRKLWAAEDAKRFLAAQIAVGTVDQAMMGALQVRHAHMRAACLARNLLVVDEVHASDTYMRVIIENLLEAHIGAGGYALLMSATLGSGARRSLLFPGQRRASRNIPTPQEAEAILYPAVITGGALEESVSGVEGNTAEKRVTIRATPAMAEFSPGRAAGAVGGPAGRQGAGNSQHRQFRHRDPARDGRRPPLPKTVRCCSPARAFRRCTTAGLPPRTGSCWTPPWRSRSDGNGPAAAGWWLAPRPWSSPWTLTPTCSSPTFAPWTCCCSASGGSTATTAPATVPQILKQLSARCSRRRERTCLPSCREAPTATASAPAVMYMKTCASWRPPVGWSRSFRESGEPWLIPEMNRMLVERATHPQALQTLVDSMGDDWVVHANQVTGARFAEDLTAHNAVIRRDRSFLDREVAFGSAEERIRTRLGDEGVKVMFEPQPASPFNPDLPIPQLSIPYHMSRGLNPEESVAATPADGGFEFDIEGAHFRYDRWGLRRA